MCAVFTCGRLSPSTRAPFPGSCSRRVPSVCACGCPRNSTCAMPLSHEATGVSQSVFELCVLIGDCRRVRSRNRVQLESTKAALNGDRRQVLFAPMPIRGREGEGERWLVFKDREGERRRELSPDAAEWCLIDALRGLLGLHHFFFTKNHIERENPWEWRRGGGGLHHSVTRPEESEVT